MTDYLLTYATQLDAEPLMADHGLDALPSTLEAMEDAVDGLVCARCPLAPDQHPDAEPSCECGHDRGDHWFGCEALPDEGCPCTAIYPETKP